MNLYVPSRLSWSQNGTRCTLTQNTQYPYQAETTMSLQLEKPEAFAIYLRLPAWAGPATRLAVNGKSVAVALKPGTFIPVRQTWNNGDRIEFSIDRPLRLSPIDRQHPNLVAVMQGPLALFSVGDVPATQTRAELLANAHKMLPYPAIKNETYRLYVPVTA